MSSPRVLLITIFLAPLVYRFINLVRNYFIARRLQLPILITPVSWQDPWWIPIQPFFQPFKSLPFCGWLGYSSHGWVLHDRYRIHHRLGPAFVIVTPGKNDIYVGDPEASKELLSKWRVWTKPQAVYKLFDIFGKNVNSVNGDDWQRHRKLASYGFKESICSTVWDESLKQGQQISNLWSGQKEILLKDIGKHSAMVAMNVLSAAAFGKRYDFGDDKGLQTPDPGHELSYGEALRTVLENIMFTILFDGLKAPTWMLPQMLRILKTATSEFRAYLHENISEEKENLAAGGDEKANLSSVLVRANEKEKEVNDPKVKGVLSDSELLGNLFIFALAGHETTATTFTYSLPLLAAYPETQAWVAEEVDDIFGKDQIYSNVFPKLVRCMAVMYETLRLWGPIQSLPKISPEPQTIKISEHIYHIPPNTFMQPNFQAVHTDPQYWGEDNLRWKPQRWVRRNLDGREALAAPPDGAEFIAWSYGPRVCPGKKFSQVEYIAVLATILRSYRIRPAVRGAETFDQAKHRLIGVIEDSVFALTVKLRRAEDAGLVLEKR